MAAPIDKVWVKGRWLVGLSKMENQFYSRHTVQIGPLPISVERDLEAERRFIEQAIQRAIDAEKGKGDEERP